MSTASRPARPDGRSVFADHSLVGRAGRESLLQLVKTADILVESFAPGHLERLGLGYRALAEVYESTDAARIAVAHVRKPLNKVSLATNGPQH